MKFIDFMVSSNMYAQSPPCVVILVVDPLLFRGVFPGKPVNDMEFLVVLFIKNSTYYA